MKHKTAKKIVLIIAGVIFVILIAVYLTGVIFFQKHFVFGTTINGIDTSWLTVAEETTNIDKVMTDYQITLKERDGKQETITASQLMLHYKDDGGVKTLLKKQNTYLWFMLGKNEKQMTLQEGVSYDTSKVDILLDGLTAFDANQVVAPANASVTDDGTNFVITPEVTGNTLNRDAVKQALMSAVSTGQTELDLEPYYNNPTILQNDANLIAQRDQMNLLVSANITYDFTDRQYVIDRNKIKEWLIKGDDGNYSLDGQKVTDYVSQMADETDTYNLSHQFTTSHGQSITLAGGGDYGWLMDRDATTQALLAALNSGTNGTLTPEYTKQGLSRAANDIGGTYAEICIAEQMMWVYKDGNLVVQTPVITGNESGGTSTPSGYVWAIDEKRANAHFKEANCDVQCWLPFNGDIGIHDASWRTPEMYNTATYKTGGSHGCINTPIDAMKKVFAALDVGDPVIVYYSPDEVVGPAPTEETSVG